MARTVEHPDERPAMRADARRNYERLLAVAKEAFEQRGVEIPLDEIARRAGVGPGTLYRHFPNREALLAAVFWADVEDMAAQAHALVERLPAEQALAEWLRLQLAYAARKRGLSKALVDAFGRDSQLFANCRVRLAEAESVLLEAGRAAGVVRSDLVPNDLLRLSHGVALAAEHSPEDGERLLSIVLAGLRPQAG